MNLVKQVALVFGCLAIGELVVSLSGIKIPSSIIGMLVLLFILKMRWIKIDEVDGVTSFLINNIGIFFVPPCVAMLNYFDILGNSIWAILVAVVGSTIAVVLITGFTHQLLRRKK